MSYVGNQPTSAAFLTDQFSGNGSTTTFTLSTAPAGTSSILVSVSGVLQDPTTYSVVGTTLTLGGAAPVGTGNISVRYLGIPASGVVTTAYRTVTEFTATAGQTTFTPPSYTVGFISVFRNGVRLGADDYTASNGTTIVLASGALVSDLITTESFYVSSVVNAIPNIPGAVVESNIASGAVTATKLSTGAVIQANISTGVSGTGPAFSAFRSSQQTVSNSTWTKIQFDSEEFDTASCYDNITNYRFTPNVAGYYQCNWMIQFDNTVGTLILTVLYKNGLAAKRGDAITGGSYSAGGSALVYLNGSTDYVEAYIYQASGGNRATDIGASTFFQATLVRAA